MAARSAFGPPTPTIRSTRFLAVTDNGSNGNNPNVTTAAYDNFGRRVTLVSPDAGRTDYVFDTASNLTQKITANLKAAGQAVNYSYQYNRLAAVTYPKFPANNSTYTYGGPGAPGNAADRLTLLTAHGGTLQRAYGPLGEVIKEIPHPSTGQRDRPQPGVHHALQLRHLEPHPIT